MPPRDHALPPPSEWTGPSAEQQLYQAYSDQQLKERTNTHYEQPPEFFCTIIGGEWHTYSCNLWSGGTTDTESQEAKLDLLAHLMHLQPGQRVLDVGCGWGGPLVYLSKKYGVQSVGLTLSPTQKRYADNRIAAHRVDATVIESHWRDFQDDQEFDAVFTDEVLAHVDDVRAFAAKAYSLLRPGGCFLNKELHFTSSRFKELSRAAVFIHELYGLAGYYRTLGEELVALDDASFSQRAVHQLALDHYRQTAEHWLANMQVHKEELRGLVGAEYYRRFRAYLKIIRELFTRGDTMTLDVVVSAKL